MRFFIATACALFCVSAILSSSAALAAELPTGESVLQIHRDNQQKLSRLHMQLTLVQETTDASCRKAQKDADQKEQLIKQFSEAKPEDIAIRDAEGKQITGEELQRLVSILGGREAREELKVLRGQTTTFRITEPMELFFDGDDYQFRTPSRNFDRKGDAAGWKFPDTPLSPETLLTTYRDMSIFSRSPDLKPAARWWHCSVDWYAYVTQNHLNEVSLVNLPPLTAVMHPRWDMRHPYDGFFSGAADKYHVIREEKVDDAILTVVDVRVPIEPNSPTEYVYRAWLDLKRGAVPMKLLQSMGTEETPDGYFDKYQPREVTSTSAVVELPNGGFYPAKTVEEFWINDPDATQLTAAEWAEVREGARKASMVVSRRHTWDCSLLEIPGQFAPHFFELPFPEGQTVSDHDTGKTIGALDKKALVRVGQKAPPLTISRWLDGKERSLDDLKGQVVVLEFWSLGSGAAKYLVAKQKALQNQFAGKPVTFISIHVAERNAEDLATRIKEFTESNEWRSIAAIDSGRMTEDSVTMNAYGISHGPLTIIVGPDGNIAFVDSSPEGPSCEEDNPKVMAEWEAVFNGFWKARFEAVGESWPIPDNLDEQEQSNLYSRVDRQFMAAKIEAAVNTTKK